MKRGSSSRESVRTFRVFPRAMLGRPCVLFVSMRAGRFSTTLPRAICKTACYVHSVYRDAWNVLTAFLLPPSPIRIGSLSREKRSVDFVDISIYREGEKKRREKETRKRVRGGNMETGGKNEREWKMFGCVATQDSVPLIGLADRSTRSLEDKDPEEVSSVCTWAWGSFKEATQGPFEWFIALRKPSDLPITPSRRTVADIMRGFRGYVVGSSGHCISAVATCLVPRIPFKQSTRPVKTAQ